MNETCIIKHCTAMRRLNSYFCVMHEEQWRASPERKRAKDVDISTHTLTMLSDFVVRVSGEGGKTS